MIKFRFKQMLAEKAYKENRSISILEVAKETGINRMTLSKIANHKGYSTVTDNIDKLCAYFNCRVSDLMEYIKDSECDE